MIFGSDRFFLNLWLVILCICCFCLFSCDDPSDIAPVVESRWLSLNKNQTNYIVQSGDTLYSVAFRYDKDYRQLADYNQLKSPYRLRVGQILHLQYPVRRVLPPTRSSPHHFSHQVNVVSNHFKPVQYRPLHSQYRPSPMAHRSSDTWIWPADGRVVTNYFPANGKKGIDIAGKKGELVYAAAPGVVAYAGQGISGYGNLIIIKHDGQYLTAYGYNARNLVREGQRISQGQRIAEMGLIDRRFFGVHFEIRQAGRPVNPLNYLRRRSTKVN